MAYDYMKFRRAGTAARTGLGSLANWEPIVQAAQAQITAAMVMLKAAQSQFSQLVLPCNSATVQGMCASAPTGSGFCSSAMTANGGGILGGSFQSVGDPATWDSRLAFVLSQMAGAAKQAAFAADSISTQVNPNAAPYAQASYQFYQMASGAQMPKNGWSNCGGGTAGVSTGTCCWADTNVIQIAMAVASDAANAVSYAQKVLAVPMAPSPAPTPSAPVPISPGGTLNYNPSKGSPVPIAPVRGRPRTQ